MEMIDEGMEEFKKVERSPKRKGVAELEAMVLLLEVKLKAQ